MLGLITDATGSTVLGMYAIAASVAISGVLMSVCFKKIRCVNPGRRLNRP
jgi:hypothetical protein